MKDYNKASIWFDDVYRKYEHKLENIPWARQDVNPMLQTFLDSQKEHKGKALVIGCGLGDDAYALDLFGYNVLAIDVSQKALDLAQKRFINSNIIFQKQDIFDMPTCYHESFDFVFESLTIQSLPIQFRSKMIRSVVNMVTKNGKLLIIANKYNGNDDGPPWPLKDDDMDLFTQYGMKILTFDLVNEESHISNTKFRVLYEKTV